MKILEIKTGYIAMEKHKFNIKDINTLTAPFVLFFINIWNRILCRPLCKHSHTFSFVWINEILYIFEAINKGYKRMTFEDKIKERGIDNFILLKPTYLYNEDIFKETALYQEKQDKYNIAILIEQIPYQLSDGRIWIGNRKLNGEVVCSKADTYNIFKSTNNQLFENFYEISPNDIFQSELFKHETLV